MFAANFALYSLSMAEHDGSYHALFSHPELVEDLLRYFVPEALIGELNFSGMQRVNAKFHAEGLERREGDIIFKIPYQHAEGAVYLYLLLEFQSQHDPWMSVRILTYVSLLYQQLIKELKLDPALGLPPVFPLVLYNGDSPWRAHLSVQELINLPPNSPLRPYQPSLRYYVLEESQFPEGKAGSIAGILFQIENIRTISDLKRCVQAFDELIPHTQASLRRAFIVWLRYVLLPYKGLELEPHTWTNLNEVREMLSTRIEKWEQDKLREGREEGREEGKARMLLNMLELKFGKLPAEIEQKISTANSLAVDQWAARLFTANSLDEVVQ